MIISKLLGSCFVPNDTLQVSHNVLEELSVDPHGKMFDLRGMVVSISTLSNIQPNSATTFKVRLIMVSIGEGRPLTTMTIVDQMLKHDKSFDRKNGFNCGRSH